MKGLFLSLVMLAGTFFVTSTVKAQPESGAKIEFEKEVHDYGNVKYGANGTCTFDFKTQVTRL